MNIDFFRIAIMETEIISPETLNLPKELIESLSKIEEEGQITIILNFKSVYPMSQRFWPSIELRSQVNGERAKLIQTLGLNPFPQWTHCAAGKQYQFCLIFESLSKEVTIFSIIEEIPEPGGYFEPNILRNKSDVYRISM